MTEIPDVALDAAIDVWRGTYKSGTRESMRLALAAADKARGIGGLTLPIEPSGAAVTMAIKSWHQENWPSAYLSDDVINNLIRCMKPALTAAYAIDGTQTAPQVSPIAHGVEDGGAVGTAPSSALRAILRRFENVSMEPGGFAYAYVRAGELDAALAELNALERDEPGRPVG